MPALEVPTMTFGAQVEDVVTGAKTKRTPRREARPRNGNGINGNGNGTAPRRTPHDRDHARASHRLRPTTPASPRS